MTRRRNTINIYDYPEHLNPFREDVEDNSDKFNTTGRRRSSFRVNAWAMFSPNKGKSKTSEDINPHSHSATSRFMTWTPKLLRRSFRRSSPPCRSSSPWEPASPSSSRLSFRSSNSQTSLPASGSSRTTLQSSSSRSMLPPPRSSHMHTLPSRRPASPPSRPAPPNIRPHLSPGSPQNLSSSTENCNGAHKETTPVPPRRKALHVAESPERPAGGLPPEEVKYVQQGAKPKKKRRAPLPPTPVKSPGEDEQVNPDVSEASLTSSIISSSITETPSENSSIAVAPNTEENDEQPEPLLASEKLEPDISEREEMEDISNTEDKQLCDNVIVEQHLQNGISEENSSKGPHVPVSEAVENELEGEEDKTIVNTKIEKSEEKTEEIPLSQTDEHLKVNFDVVLHISEEDLREDKEHNVEKNDQIHSESDENHNVEHVKENGIIPENNLKNNLDVREQETEVGLQNGDSAEPNNFVLQSETKSSCELSGQSPLKAPEPKPRTILPNSLKD